MAMIVLFVFFVIGLTFRSGVEENERKSCASAKIRENFSATDFIVGQKSTLPHNLTLTMNFYRFIS